MANTNNSQRSLCSLKREFKYRKPICPFICSTFQDFQVERDILVKKVFPTIDALCRERGTFCAPIDLRWGINDHQVSSGQVVNLCLDYVTKCAPFFICILGERFGSHRPHEGPPLPKSYKDFTPDAHWMDKNLVIASSSGYDWVKEEPFRNYSVTALEVAQRGKLAKEMGDDFSFYYFRQQEHLDHLFPDLTGPEREEKLQVYQPESEHCREECRDLKTRIVKRGIPVRYFKTPDELRQLVLDDWIAVVNRLYPPFYHGLPDSHRESLTEWMAHEAFAETRRRVFVRTPELSQLFKELTQFALTALDDPPPQIPKPKPITRSVSYSSFLRNKKPASRPELTSTLLLVGERGCGKSSVIANWFQEFQNDHPEVKVINHYVGCNAHSVDLHALMRRFTHEIRNEYPDFQGNAAGMSNSSNDDVSDFHNVCEAFHAALGLGPCVLVLDGVDELGETYGCSNNQVKEMTWLPCPLPPQCKVVVTSTYSDTTHRSLSLREDTKTLHVPLLKETSSKAEVIKEYLAIHCKCLNDKQLQHVVNCKLSDRPIFLSVLANELRVYGVYSCLEAHLESYLEATSIRDLWSKIIQRWVKEYGWTGEETSKDSNNDSDKQELSGWVADALRLLAVSRSGLSRSEILDLLEQLGYSGSKRVTTLEWAAFRSAAMDSLLERPGGLLNFFHQHFKEAVEHTLLGSATPSVYRGKQPTIVEKLEDFVIEDPKKKKVPKRQEYHKHIADYFLHMNHCCRRSEELPWQLERAGEMATLAEVLSEPRLFLEMAGDRIMHRKRLELVMHWKNLMEAGFDISITYWRMLKRASGTSLCSGLSSVTSLDKIAEESAQNQYSHTARPTSSAPIPVPKIPQIMKTCPSDASSTSSLHTAFEDSEARVISSSVPNEIMMDTNTDKTMGDRRMSIESIASNDSCSSFASSVDPSEGPRPPPDLSAFRFMFPISSFTGGDVYHCNSKLIRAAFPDGYAKGPKELARLTMSTGQFLSIMSCFVDAEKMLLTAHDKLGQVSFSAESQRLLCGLEESIGNMYLYQLRKDEATRWYNMALKTVDEHLVVLKNTDNENVLQEMKGRLLDQLGNMKTYNRDFKGAETMLTRAKACFEKSKCTIGHAIVHYHIGFLRMQQGNFEEAEHLFADALGNIERWFGKNHPRVAEVLNDLASLMSHPNNKHSYDVIQAETIHRRALQIRETCFGPDHLMVATSLFHLGTLLKSLSSHPAQREALVMLRRALDIRTTRLGTNHGLTKAVRRVLHNLEVSLQLRTKPAPDARSAELPYSLLTCHEQQLSILEKRAKQKAKEAMELSKKRKEVLRESKIVWREKEFDPNEDGSELSDSEGTFGESSEGSITHSTESDEGLSSADSDADFDDRAGLSNTSTEETVTEENNASTQDTKRKATIAPNHYLDSFVLELPKHSARLSNQRTPPRRSRSVNFRPKSAPVYSAELATSNLSLQTPRSRMDVLSHYSTVANRKRLNSAPATVKYPRRTSMGSAGGAKVSHRRTCSIPGPHTIDVHNAHCTVYGPNASLNSLLGDPEAPRYSAYSKGIHHTSAWYHIPGRYSTVDRPFAPKRLQKRVSQQRNSLGGSLKETGSRNWGTPRSRESMNTSSGVQYGNTPKNGVFVNGSNMVLSH